MRFEAFKKGFVSICFVLLVGLSTGASAHDWTLMLLSDTGSEYYIDRDSLVSKADRYVAWYKIKLSSQAIKNNHSDYLPKGYCYHTVLCEIDCKQKLMKTLITGIYDKNDELLKRVETPRANWSKIPEDSAFMLIYKWICKK